MRPPSHYEWSNLTPVTRPNIKFSQVPSYSNSAMQARRRRHLVAAAQLARSARYTQAGQATLYALI